MDGTNGDGDGDGSSSLNLVLVDLKASAASEATRMDSDGSLTSFKIGSNDNDDSKKSITTGSMKSIKTGRKKAKSTKAGSNRSNRSNGSIGSKGEGDLSMKSFKTSGSNKSLVSDLSMKSIKSGSGSDLHLHPSDKEEGATTSVQREQKKAASCSKRKKKKKLGEQGKGKGDDSRVHDDFTDYDYDIKMAGKTKKTSSTSNRSGLSSFGDPDGYASSTKSLYDDDEGWNRLFGRRGDDEEEEEEEDGEECELMNDTFTFLMTAEYPFESCLLKTKKDNGDNGDNGEVEPQEDEERELKKESYHSQQLCNKSTCSSTPTTMKLKRTTSSKTTSTKNAATADANPDHMCLPFWVGCLVLCSQLFIYTIVIANTLNNQDLPPNADAWLRLSQIFAMFVTLYTQSDFIDGIFLFTESSEAFSDITNNGTIKFKVSALSRVLVGLCGISATFILVMYAEEVVDLLLNFTAMEFVATLDGSFFELAAKGFLGAPLEKKCEEIRSFRYKPKHSKRRRRCRFSLYVFFFIAVFAAWGVIFGLQQNRQVGVDNEIYVQFDDTGLPELYGISGVYKGCKGFKSDYTKDIGYIDISDECPEKKKKNKNEDEDGVMRLPARSFVYCTEREGWMYLPKDTEKPCEKGEYVLRSFLDEDTIPSNAFDILTFSKANWVIHRSDIGGESTLSNFFIESVQKIQSDFTYCEYGLRRTDKRLKKDQDAFKPLEDKPKFYPTYGNGNKSMRDKESDDNNDETYGKAFGLIYRPLYFRKVKVQTQKPSENAAYQVVLFDGLRWNRMYLRPSKFASHIGREKECNDDPDCWNVFLKYFHNPMKAENETLISSWQSYPEVVVFDGISEPMMILSTTDTGQPTKALRWYDSRLVEEYDEVRDVTFTRIVPTAKEKFEVTENEISDDYDYDDDFIDGDLDPQVAIAISSLHNEVVGLSQEVDDLSQGESDGGFGFQCRVVTDNCRPGEKKVQIDFSTDSNPEESSIIVFGGQGKTSNKNLKERDLKIIEKEVDKFTVKPHQLLGLDFSYADANTDYFITACSPEVIKCIQVIVLDHDGNGISGDGYTISYGDETHTEIKHGKKGGFKCRVYKFGTTCGNTDEAKCEYKEIVEDLSKLKDENELLPIEQFFDGQKDTWTVDPKITISPAPTTSPGPTTTQYPTPMPTTSPAPVEATTIPVEDYDYEFDVCPETPCGGGQFCNLDYVDYGFCELCLGSGDDYCNGLGLVEQKGVDECAIRC